MNYTETLNYINSLNPFNIKLGLHNIHALLSLLDYPQNKFKSILVAGTNGKGSTSTMIANILEYSGLKTGIYTSPHIINFNERIVINRLAIDENSLISVVNFIKAKTDQHKGISFTYFEFVTATAFVYFAQENVDIAVLEVGLGGRLDATNIVTPTVSVITEVDIDHSEILGEHLSDIVKEKGGIIKPNSKVVLSSKNVQVSNIIKNICEYKNASLSIFKEDFFSKVTHKTDSGQIINFKNERLSLESINIPLFGKYQAINASAAIETVLKLYEDNFINNDAIREGLSKVKIHGRMEIVSKNPLVITDIAHNPGAAKSLIETLLDCFPDKEIIFILSIMKDKDIEGIVKILAPIGKKIIITKANTPRAADPLKIKKFTKEYNSEIYINLTIREAVSFALSSVNNNALICITGSCYTVSEALKVLL